MLQTEILQKEEDVHSKNFRNLFFLFVKVKNLNIDRENKDMVLSFHKATIGNSIQFHEEPAQELTTKSMYGILAVK